MQISRRDRWFKRSWKYKKWREELIMYEARIFMYVLLQYVQSSYATSMQCKGISTNHFGFCGSKYGEAAFSQNHKKNRVSIASSSTSLNTSEGDLKSKKNATQCTHEGICGKVFKVSRIRRQSFGAKTLMQISDMIYTCCGECGKYMLTDVFSQPHENSSTLQSSDIIYPVLGRSSVQNLYGLHYIPVFEVSSSYYFTLGKSKKEMAYTMVIACLNMWPLFIICLMMCFIAGFIAWFMEMSTNGKEFPPSFYIGLYEGFWWSFVSMTTVGYGDRTPKSPAGRMFAVVWILIGITILSIFTASLTTELINARSPPDPNLTGMKVGGLKDRLHDSIMVAQHGGILKEVNFNNTITGIIELYELLHKKQIDGFLVTRSTYYYFSRIMKEEKKYKEQARKIINMNIIRTEKHFEGEKLVSGVLMKDTAHYVYFKKYIEDNWLLIQACDSYNLNYQNMKYKSTDYSPIEGLFYVFLLCSLGVLSLIACFGIYYEKRRTVTRKAERKYEADRKDEIKDGENSKINDPVCGEWLVNRLISNFIGLYSKHEYQ